VVGDTVSPVRALLALLSLTTAIAACSGHAPSVSAHDDGAAPAGGSGGSGGSSAGIDSGADAPAALGDASPSPEAPAGTIDASTGADAGEPVCPADLKDGITTCQPGSDVTGVKGCGPDHQGTKACACDPTAAVYACDACMFAAGRDYSCYRLPAVVPACPAVTHSNTDCTAPPCTPCSGYVDGSGVTKVGYCVCSAGKWSCGSTHEWPPQQ
jgi:hypothetical protein